MTVNSLCGSLCVNKDLTLIKERTLLSLCLYKRLMIISKTCIPVELLGPCFKTGQIVVS